MTRSIPRLAVVDNARALLSLLGIPFHTILFFCLSLQHSLLDTQPTLLQLTYQIPKIASQTLSAMFFIHSFWMPCFFLLAGFIARLLCQVKGLKGFVYNRLMKIAVPFLFCWLWKVPFYFMLACIVQVFFHNTVGLQQQLANHDDLWKGLKDLKDLWFLYDLLWLDALTILMVWLTAYSIRIKNQCYLLDRMTQDFFSHAWCPWLLAVFFTVLLFSQPNLGYRPLDVRLLPSFNLVFFYGIWYGIGWRLQKHQVQIAKWFSHSFVKVGLAIALYTLYMISYFHGYAQLTSWLYGSQLFLYQLSACFMVLTLLAVAWRYLQAKNPALTYLSNAAYWNYLTQVPIILVLIGLFRPNGHHFYTQSLLLMLSAFALSLGSYQLFVRHTWLNHFVGQKLRT